MTFDWAFAWEVLPQLVGALRVTALATALGMALAAVLGLVWVLLRRTHVRIIAWFTGYWIDFLRSTPLLVQIYFLYYLLPDTGVRLSAMVTGVTALGLHYSAYLSEVYRAGIEAVPRGQWEASRALGLTLPQTWRLVILPQAAPPMIPAAGNYLIAMFKDTPMLSAITVIELLQRAKMIGSEHFRYLEPLTLVGILFLMLSLAASAGVRWSERRFRVEAAA